MIDAWQLEGDQAPYELQLNKIPLPQVESQGALVRLKSAALNHRDQWILEGMYPGIKTQRTLGSDGCGVIEQVGVQDNEHWIGKEVIINPNINWGDNPEVQSKEFNILGNPSNGTFASAVAVPLDRLHTKPEHLTTQEAAALPLGGLTAYRAVFTKGKITSEDTVLINGVGGGVAQFAFQFALAAGAKVYVTSGKDHKLQAALKLGATGGVNYKKDDWHKELLAQSGGFDCVIDSAGGSALNSLIRMMNYGGRIVTYGATLGKPEQFDIQRVFYHQLQIIGSTMGNDEEFVAMIDFVEKHQIKPIIDAIIPFKEAPNAFKRMEEGSQFGKIVLQISDDTIVGKVKQKFMTWMQKTVGR